MEEEQVLPQVVEALKVLTELLQFLQRSLLQVADLVVEVDLVHKIMVVPEVLGVEAQLVVLFQEHLAAQAQLVQHVKERLVVMEFKCLIHVHTQVVEAELVVLLPEKLVVLEKLLL